MTDYALFEILTDTISYTLGNDFERAFQETFNGPYMQTIAETAKEYVKNKLAEYDVDTDETINDIPVYRIISQLIDTIEIRVEELDGVPVYVIGWFDEYSIKLAKLFEYGTQSGNNVKQAHPIIQNIMISEESASLSGIITSMLDGIITNILNRISK